MWKPEHGSRGCSHLKAQPGQTSILYIQQLTLAVGKELGWGFSTRAVSCGLSLGFWLCLAWQLDSKRKLAKNKCSKRPGLKPQGSWRLSLGSHAVSLPLHPTGQKQVTEPAQVQGKGTTQRYETGVMACQEVIFKDQLHIPQSELDYFKFLYNKFSTICTYCFAITEIF